MRDVNQGLRVKFFQGYKGRYRAHKCLQMSLGTKFEQDFFSDFLPKVR